MAGLWSGLDKKIKKNILFGRYLVNIMAGIENIRAGIEKNTLFVDFVRIRAKYRLT